MLRLLRTSKVGVGRKAHYHIVLVDEEAGQAIAGTVQNHTHQIQFRPPTEPQVDEAGNVIAEGAPGEWVVLPDIELEGVGHIHEGPFEEVEAVEKKQTEEDKDIINSVLTQYSAWRELERESYDSAIYCDKFVDGEQWDETLKGELKRLERACLTINYTSKMLDELLGYERDQRQSFGYSPVEGGDARAADMYNEVKTHITDSCYYDREKSEAFEDTCRVGRGLLNIYVDHDDDIFGELKIERFPWDGAVFAAHEKKDLSDCEGLIKHKWFSEAKFNQFWPEKAKEIKEAWGALESVEEPVVHEDASKDKYDQGKPYSMVAGGDPTVDLRKKEIKVYERWLAIYEKTPIALSEDGQLVQSCYGWRPGDAKQVETIPGLYILEKNVKRIRITRCTALCLLSDENPADLPAEDFYLVPVYAKKRGDKFWGKVRDAIDPQKEINHRHSQAVDIGNKMAAYGWFIDPGTFGGDGKEEKKFVENSSKPGFVAKVADVGRPPLKSEGVKFPSEVVQLLQLGTETLSTILNVTVEPGGANESGKALLEKRRQRLIGNEYLFDNLSWAQVKIGRLLLPLIRKYYSPERIYRIVASRSQTDQVSVGGQPLETWPKDEIIAILEQDDIEKYDVTVKEIEASPTVRMGTFLLLSELIQSGMPIPPEPLIDLLDVPQTIKDNIQQSIAAQSQAQADAEQMKKEMEENKALIAHGVIPPEVQQRLAAGSPQVQGDVGANQAMPPGEDPMAGM